MIKSRVTFLTFLVVVLTVFTFGIYYFEGNNLWLNIWTDFFWTSSSFICSVRCFITSRKMTIRSLKLSWRWLGIGTGLWTLGMLVWSWRQLIENVNVPFPDISTFLYLGMVPCIILALMYYCWNVSHRENKFLTLADIGISLCVISFVCIILFYRPISMYQGSKFYLIMVLAYPCLYITALFFATLQIWESKPINKLPYTLLMIGLAFLAGVNIAYSYGLLYRVYQPGKMLDVLWTVGFFIFYWAALEEESQVAKKVPVTSLLLKPNLARALFPGITMFVVIAAALTYQTGFEGIEIIMLSLVVVFTLLIGLRAWVTQNAQFKLQSVAEENSKKLDAVIQQMPAGLIITDMESDQILFYNNQAAQILHGHLSMVSDLKQNKEEVDLTFEDGQVLTVLRQISNVETKFKEKFSVITFMDITEKKLVYEEAKRVAQIREDFLLLVSHELKTPLTTLKLGMQFVEKKSDENMKRFIRPCLEEIRRFENLTNDLIDISNIDAGKLSLDPEKLNLREVVQNVTNRFEFELASKKYAIEFKVMEDVWGQWDRLRIEQVIVNLLNNAIKYGEQKPIEIMVYGDNNFGIFSIRDHGPGIPKEDRQRIFHKFERAASTKHFGGFGIGLFVSKTIAEAHKGNISVGEGEGGGAIFTVRLPL